jgi:hypothetical protein
LFAQCASLTSVVIPEAVTAIGDNAFNGCTSLTSISLPATAITLGFQAFANCTALGSFTISSGVSMAGSVFSGCSNLSAINVDAANPYYSSLDGVLFNKIRSALLKFPEAKGGHYMIPATVTRLGNQAFNSVSGLTRLTFLGDAPELGADVFTGSNALTSIIYNSSKSGWSSTFGGLTAHAAPLPSVLSHAVISGEHGAGFNLTFTSVEGFSYNVQSSQDLQTWTSAQTFTGTGNPIQFSDISTSVHALPASLYYRVVQN